MKVEIKIVDLEHEELVDILSTATYGNGSFSIATNKNLEPEIEQIRKQYSSQNLSCCIEDIWACLWERGFNLILIDEEEPMEMEMSLNEFLDKISNQEALGYIKDTISGEGDLYDAWNLFQIAMYGEVIYG